MVVLQRGWLQQRERRRALPRRKTPRAYAQRGVGGNEPSCKLCDTACPWVLATSPQCSSMMCSSLICCGLNISSRLISCNDQQPLNPASASKGHRSARWEPGGHPEPPGPRPAAAIPIENPYCSCKPVRGSWLTAATHMDNPYCSYKLTRGPQGAGAHPLSSKSIDVQGFSHKHLLDYMYAHTAIPDESCCVFSISSFGFACAVLRFWRTHGESGSSTRTTRTSRCWRPSAAPASASEGRTRTFARTLGRPSARCSPHPNINISRLGAVHELVC